MTTARTATLVAATVSTGLLAGLFYAYSCPVMPAWKASSDRSMVEVMQNINVSIQNGWFFLTFMGAPILIAVAALLQLGKGGDRRVLAWTIAGFVLVMAMIVITAAVNVPLNNDLEAAGLSDNAAVLAQAREKFESTWVRWNIVRTVANIAGFGCVTWALAVYSRVKTGS
ncbi:MAG: DUF1772 domain-containing protein [Pseudonocardiaceae bacterium]